MVVPLVRTIETVTSGSFPDNSRDAKRIVVAPRGQAKVAQRVRFARNATAITRME
jgi:hypothetical protein